MIIVDPLLDFEFICKEKSDDIYFKYNKPKLIKTVLKNDFPWEGECNGYYSIIKDNNNIYKLYYRANKCSIRTGHEESTPYNLLCVALSVDGINFEKPKLDIVLNAPKDINSYNINTLGYLTQALSMIASKREKEREAKKEAEKIRNKKTKKVDIHIKVMQKE